MQPVSHAASYKVVLATVGSLGDLHPFMALALALRARGVNVVLACAVEYQSKVTAAGIPFALLRPGFDELQRDLGMDRARLTRSVIEDSSFLFRKLVLPYVRAAYVDMLEAVAGADMVVTSSLAFGARLAAEKRGIPWISVVLQPMMFFSAYDPPLIPGAQWATALLRKLGPGATRLVLSVVKQSVNLLFRPLHKLRSDIGLPPARTNPLFDGQFGIAGALGMYSKQLGEAQADYPRPNWIVGFAPFDSADGAEAALDPDLDNFISAGLPPLVFTLGSLIVNSPGNFYSESVEVSRNVKRRAVLLVGEDGGQGLSKSNSTDIFVCAYAPHSLLFPRAAAIIHQGGIGTLAQALRSGKPQLIVPFFADQIDNAARARRLGVARVLSPRSYTRVSAGLALTALLGIESHHAYAARAAQIGLTVRTEDGAARAASIILDTLEQLERK
jgi:rhamnosyltransferase subunit B